MRNVGRRKSVFAEAYNPEEDEDDKPPVSCSLKLIVLQFIMENVLVETCGDLLWTTQV